MEKAQVTEDGRYLLVQPGHAATFRLTADGNQVLSLFGPNDPHVRAVRRRVCVRPLDDIRSGLIVLLTKEPPTRGIVVSMGQDAARLARIDGWGCGDEVLLRKLEGTYLEVDGCTTIAMDVDHVLGVVES